MNFTDLMPFKCAEYSHKGHYLAISKTNELTIYNSQNFTTEYHYVVNEQISQISWSPDDMFIFIFLGKLQEVHFRCFNS